jgi:UDP-2,4-diacetamido-2,4,6-trideoxy-beta-L-altropyranose hydrolase
MGPLLIRADASSRIGSGHVMRCLAIAQAWQDAGGRACLGARVLPEGLRRRWLEEGMDVRQLTLSGDDAVQTLELAHEIGAEWLILDGYHFGTDFQRFIKNAGTRLLVVDDDGCAGQYVADLIVNQSPGAVRDLYLHSSATLLLGTRFALLRREFLRARPANRSFPSRGRNALVTLGGADPDNCTLAILKAIALIEGLSTNAVIGPNNPCVNELAQFASGSCGRITIRRNVHDMPEVMAEADLAVSAAGSTCWELAFMGLPMLLVILADNQRLNATTLGSLGVAQNLGWHSELSEEKVRLAVMDILEEPELRRSMSQKALELVDGCGARRVVNEMRSRPFRSRAGAKNST